MITVVLISEDKGSYMNPRYRELYSSIINSIAARTTIVIASINLLNAIGPIVKNSVNRFI
jgi:hypothetical protein